MSPKTRGFSILLKFEFMWSPGYRLVLTLIVLLSALPSSRAQTKPSSASKAPVAASDSVRACLEQLDIFACERAQKLRLAPKEKAEVIIYDFAAAPVCAPEPAVDHAIKLDPQNALAYFLKAESIRCYGNWPGAVPLYLKAIELNPEWKAYYVDVALLMNGDPAKFGDQLTKTWQLALSAAPDDPRGLTGYAQALALQKKTEEARAAFQKALDRDPADANAAYGLCQYYLDQKDPTHFRPLCKLATGGISSMELSTLGFLLNRADEPLLAEQAYRRAMQLDPKDPGNTVRLNLIYTLINEKKTKEAIKLYEEFIAKYPEQASEVMGQYAYALEQDGQLKKAEALYQHEVESRNDGSNLSALAGFYLRQKKYEEAATNFKLAMLESWRNFYLVPQLREAYAPLGPQRHQELVTFEDQLVAAASTSLSAQTSDSYYTFANLLKQLGRLPEAAKAYRKAADLDTNEVPPLGGLGEVLHDLGRHQEAVAAYEEAEHRRSGYLSSAPELKKHYEDSRAALKGKMP
jgi:tetratricopeptide (TPR) repeat protein